MRPFNTKREQEAMWHAEWSLLLLCEAQFTISKYMKGTCCSELASLYCVALRALLCACHVAISMLSGVALTRVLCIFPPLLYFPFTCVRTGSSLLASIIPGRWKRKKNITQRNCCLSEHLAQPFFDERDLKRDVYFTPCTRAQRAVERRDVLPRRRGTLGRRVSLEALQRAAGQLRSRERGGT